MLNYNTQRHSYAMTSVSEIQLSITTLCVVAAATLPSIFAFLYQAHQRMRKDDFYEDADGRATPESVAAFSQRASKRAALALTTLGLAASLVFSVLGFADKGIHNFPPVDWIVSSISVS